MFHRCVSYDEKPTNTLAIGTCDPGPLRNVLGRVKTSMLLLPQTVGLYSQGPTRGGATVNGPLRQCRGFHLDRGVLRNQVWGRREIRFLLFLFIGGDFSWEGAYVKKDNNPSSSTDFTNVITISDFFSFFCC